jgi:hypothetical protein
MTPLRGTFLGNLFFWLGQFLCITQVLFMYTYDYANYMYLRGGQC